MTKHVFVITGAAGTGKTTVAAYLRDRYNLHRVITHTTRQPRPGEHDGVDYYFETPESIRQRHLLEMVHYDHHLYGSSMEGLQDGWKDGQDDVIVLDTKGAATYHRELGAAAVIIFLKVSHLKMLTTRIKMRGDRISDVKARVQASENRRDAHLPVEIAPFAHVVLNDNWQITQRRLDRIMHRYGY
ncbi:guanylate kinase [Limosilactobacillus sp.]|uniref:guanylate kinase n=1 Tax=Limosilactobacillus sp. TaxID=2773925 RepID=UPI00345E3081